MHYIPETTTEMLCGDAQAPTAVRHNFHYVSTPLYVLTAIVATLLLADWFAVQPGAAGWTLWGYRFALLAAVIGGSRILYHTLDGLLSGRIGSDLALAIACLAAIALGEYQTAGLVVLIALIGESLEGYTIDRARAAVQETFALWPALAHRVVGDDELDVAASQLVTGDTVIVRPGERIPVDGRVVAGSSVVDQSPFTGESVPIDKVPGSHVLAGTLNQFGSLTIVASAIGDQTALSRMAQLVGAATARKAKLERVADRLARWFLPAVLMAALLTIIGWRLWTGSWRAGVLPALSVLVVSCPCPLILATPCAVMASLAWLARRGVVIKGSSVLERLAHIDTVVFDKTGTLTQGTLVVGEIVTLVNVPVELVLRAAAIAERSSEHPLARVIMATAREQGVQIPFPTEFQAIPGAGVIAQIPMDDWLDQTARSSWNLANTDSPGDNSLTSIVVGNRRILDHAEVEYSPEIAVTLRAKEQSGEQPIVVAVDGRIIGLIGVRERVRPESQQVIQELRSLGITQLALLTGDRELPATRVVEALGPFDNVVAELLPEDKARWIDTAKQGGRCVAMIGDGVNDAPALAVSDVGIALGQAGGDLAAAAGEIVLLGDPLRPLPGLVRLSRALVQNIWQSILIFAFGFNLLGVLLCSLGWLNPIGGAVFHEVASLAVMANAMRLLWFEGSAQAAHRVDRILNATDWLIAQLSPSQWIYWAMAHWQLGFRLALAVAATVWCCTGLIQLNPDEIAVVTRFGKYETTLQPGIHWVWPYPLDRVIRTPVNRVRTVTVGYRERIGEGLALAAGGRSSGATPFWGLPGSGKSAARSRNPVVEWTSHHDELTRSGAAEEGTLLTAEEVPVEMAAEVQYRVRDLKQLVFAGPERPDDVIRSVAESALREVAASASLDGLLTERRAELERRSSELLRSRLEHYGMGIEILELQWLDVHPPQAVVPAYRQVADALEERELLLNEAEAYVARTLLATIGPDALAFLQASVKDKDSSTWKFSTRVDWALDDALWRQLRGTPEAGGTKLSGTVAAILADGEKDRVERESAARATATKFEKLYAEYQSAPQQTRSLIYWKAMTDALSQRPITVVDPQAVRRQQFWLGNSLPNLMLPQFGPQRSEQPLDQE